MYLKQQSCVTLPWQMCSHPMYATRPRQSPTEYTWRYAQVNKGLGVTCFCCYGDAVCVCVIFKTFVFSVFWGILVKTAQQTHVIYLMNTLASVGKNLYSLILTHTHAHTHKHITKQKVWTQVLTNYEVLTWYDCTSCYTNKLYSYHNI